VVTMLCFRNVELGLGQGNERLPSNQSLPSMYVLY